ncbi:hypothetical protein [Halobaculum litoreum]|uniref:Uncharacterized protein n=1 Tax=Halobaculum litoreum TaxID=3031998 RepID=A0ABD5XPA9_9EURY|nr:hypothetical protein [Halobaculum sp. DT92]
MRGRALVAVEGLARMDSRFFADRELADLLVDAGLRGHVVDPGFGYTVVGVQATGAGEAAPAAAGRATGDAGGDADAERGR